MRQIRIKMISRIRKIVFMSNRIFHRSVKRLFRFEIECQK